MYKRQVQACREKAANYSCENACRNEDDGWSVRERKGYARSCIQSCKANNSSAVAQARRYYEFDLPQRQQAEMQTLMRYTGWNIREAERFVGSEVAVNDAQGNKLPQVENKDKWWERLFNPGKVK